MTTIRSVLLAAAAEAKAQGLPVDDVAANVHEDVDDAGRAVLVIGEHVVDNLKARGVTLGNYPDGGVFFFDVDGKRVRFVVAKPAPTPAALPPGFMGGERPKTRDAFGTVVDDRRPMSRQERRALLPRMRLQLPLPAKEKRSGLRRADGGVDTCLPLDSGPMRGARIVGSAPPTVRDTCARCGVELKVPSESVGEATTGPKVVRTDLYDCSTCGGPCVLLACAFAKVVDHEVVDSRKGKTIAMLRDHDWIDEIGPDTRPVGPMQPGTMFPDAAPPLAFEARLEVSNDDGATWEPLGKARPFEPRGEAIGVGFLDDLETDGRLKLDRSKIAAVIARPTECPACGGDVVPDEAGAVLRCVADRGDGDDSNDGCGWCATIVNVVDDDTGDDDHVMVDVTANPFGDEP